MEYFEARHWRYVLYRSHVNLLSDASRYYLGWLWWFIEPLAMVAVFFVVFTYLRPRGDGFIYFLIIGVTMWMWFSGSISNATQSLAGAKGLILQMQLPKLLFPIIAFATAAYKQVFVVAMLLVFIAATQGVHPSWVALPLLLGVQILLTAAVVPVAAVVCVLVPDARFIIVSALQLTMFCSGIFFDIADMPERAQFWFRLNPMAVALEQYRTVLLDGRLPDLAWCAAVAAASGVAIVVSVAAFKRFDLQLTRRVIAL